MTVRPAFAPTLAPDGSDTVYFDGLVHGVCTAQESDGRRVLVIHEWTSLFPSEGHTVAVLRWLRARFDTIVANGVGSLDEDGVGDIPTYYWKRMRGMGLVDVALLDDGTELPADFGDAEAPSPG